MADDVLTAERAHLVRARADLKRMREHTRTLLDTQSTWGNDELTTRALAASLARRGEQQRHERDVATCCKHLPLSASS